MALTSGMKLGPYEIQSPLGAGGMGEVYRARDTRLGRDVAIKVLPESFASDAERLQRFEHEARILSALNHPNLLAIHDVGAQEGIHYLVSEFLEGQTLRERIGSGVLSARKLTEYALQITNGLAAAHQKGIVHRDLKPENIFVTKEERVKILDFGLAKQSSGAANLSGTSATLTRPTPTMPGTVMGTVGYMSPEQVRGQTVDHRSDIFSFGAILYEMIAGKRAFRADTSVETMNAILKEEPPELSASSLHVSPGMERIVRRCLEKAPDQRFQSASDLAFAIESLSGASSPSSIERATTASAPGKRHWLVAVGIAGVLAALLVAFWMERREGVRTTGAGITFEPLSYRPQNILHAAFAPDGKTVVYSTLFTGNAPEIFELGPDYPAPRSLGLKGTQLLSLSSKGELALLTHVRYLGQLMFRGTLARMPLGGGAPRELLEDVSEADWASDGETLAIVREVNGKDRLEYPIGKVLFESAGYLSDLRVSPDGSKVAFFIHPFKYDDRGDVAVVDRAGNKTGLASGFWGEEGLAWSPGGDEVLFGAGEGYSSFVIYAVSLSGKKQVALRNAGGLFLKDISRSGRWLVTHPEIRSDMMVKGPGDKQERNLSFLEASHVADLSADGKTLLFTESSGRFGSNYEVCTRQTDGSPVVCLGPGSAMQLSPDSKWALAIVRSSPDRVVLYPTGAGEAQTLESAGIPNVSWARWFPEGKSILLCGHEPNHGERCYEKEIDGKKLRAITPEGTANGFPSPDGKLVVASAGPGKWLLYPRVGGDPPRPLPTIQPDDAVTAWRADGAGLLVISTRQIPAPVQRIEVASGRRTLLRQLTPPDPIGAGGIWSFVESADGSSYAYGVQVQRSSLFLVEGAK
jgi:eukaryotic-like serine/threonine-protein kinase